MNSLKFNLKGKTHNKLKNLCGYFFVAILALGLQPKQGLARVRAKKEARESRLMLLGV
jgi:hypothetical protein